LIIFKEKHDQGVYIESKWFLLLNNLMQIDDAANRMIGAEAGADGADATVGV